MVESGSAYRDERIVPLGFRLQAMADLSSEGVTDGGLSLTLADYQTLLEELAQAQAVDRERVDRIHQLEQALDQTLAHLDELRLQMKDQEVLEHQLATTETFSHVQQQAIVRLKLQLAEQQQELDAQILETQQRDQAIQELMATIEAMTQAQQREIDRLRSYLVQDQVEVKNHRHLLGQQIQELQISLESRQRRIAELEAETLATRTLTVNLREQLATAQQQSRDLSVRLKQQQARHYAQWQHNQQQLEQERDQLQTRVVALEQQTAEMQEQILHQAQQSTEYETAVQYWKDRYTVSHRQLTHLRELVEQAVEQLSLPAGSEVHGAGLVELLHTLSLALSADAKEGTWMHPPSRLQSPELPDFLVRRRQKMREQELPLGN